MSAHPLLAAELRRALPSMKPRATAALASDLGRLVAEFAKAPTPTHLTQAQARKQATVISDLATRLGRELDRSVIADHLGMVGRIVNGEASLNDDDLLRLRALLSALRSDAQAVLRATGDDQQVPQVQLPRRGDKSDAPARRVAHVVLWELSRRGAIITTTENGPAVQCVQAAFHLGEINADPRHCVRSWVERHPKPPPR